jgi:type I restriction enzyme S subunit
MTGIESGTSVNATDTPADIDELGVLKTSCVYRGFFDPEENKTVIAEDRDRVSCPLRAGTVIVSRMNTPDLVGAAGLVKTARAGIFLPDRLWQVTVEGSDPAYVHYWTLTSEYRSQVQMACSGTSSSMQNLSQAQFSSFAFPNPPRSEQTAIASFLDRETAKIDALMAEQRILIELLKEKRQAVIFHAVTKGLNSDAPMKESGVEWLGQVPTHWEVFRLGSVFVEANDQGAEDLPILTVSIHNGVSDKELDEYEMDRKVTRSDDRTKYKGVKPGDLVYNMMRAWQGGFGAVTVEGQVSPAYVVARPLREVLTEFVEQTLRTPPAVEEMRRLSYGVADFRLRLYWQNFKTIVIALPPALEQGSIMDAVRSQTDRFDALTAEAEQAIALLQERRTALISAAVTGKIDVRGCAQ